MFLSPYQTTVGRTYAAQLNKVGPEVATAITTGDTVPPRPGVVGIPPYADYVPLFSQPLTAFEQNSLGKSIAIDLRSYVTMRRQYPGDRELSIKSPIEYDALLRRANILLGWLNGDPAAVMRLHTVPYKVFIDLFGRSLGGRLGLIGHDYYTLQLIVGHYYGCLHITEDDYDENAPVINSWVTRALRGNPNDVTDNVDDLHYMTDIDALAQCIKANIHSPRVGTLNGQAILIMLSGGWFGYDARTTMGIALEHPPTWLWMIEQAMSSKTYKRTMLGKLAQESIRAVDADQFVKALNYFTK